MNQPAELQLTSDLHQKAKKAFDYALRALASAEPLVPFAMTWQKDETTIERFMYAAYDDSIELALQAVNQSDQNITAYAVVWSGYVEVDGQKHDAVVMEIGDRKDAQSAELAQPYRSSNDESSIVPRGDILALGSTNNLLISKLEARKGDRLVKPAYVTSDAYVTDVKSQPFAQMPVALICLAANLFGGQESERVTVGIRALQDLESKAEVAMTRRVLSVITAEVASGDLMAVLPTDNVEELLQLVVAGAAQVHVAVKKGLVAEGHAASYFNGVATMLQAVLTNNGSEAAPERGERLTKLLGATAAAVAPA